MRARSGLLVSDFLVRGLLLFGLLSALVAVGPCGAEPAAIDLSGSWSFRLDRDDRGLTDAWWRQTLSDRIRLPGALQAQGFGDDVTVDTQWTGQIVDRSWFTAPEYAKYRQAGQRQDALLAPARQALRGAAWYQRDVDVPATWQGKRLVLSLERPHWETRVWLDGRAVGSNNSLSTPHVYDLGTSVAPGKHRLDDPRRQPAGRRRGRQLPQRDRPHAEQLERHRGAHAALRPPSRWASTISRSIPTSPSGRSR